ncbi:MAG: bifunctional UDP-N-acetylglucosamine diphosphorylase/glucosamine-1-phosphate N-acetyltransferase GlmU [Gammaproteobacteria bacterium]|nr:bifunctional UDP-N-acetylglucosamine diphosphorylase/glucosamine-1-phosphate N-acetyltransferase GlmU [Gammaproteobacteria bacterium]
MTVEVIILAAGMGKRMHSTLPKVLHPLGGRPILHHLLDTVHRIRPDRVHIVVGHGKGHVIENIENEYLADKKESLINWVEQTEQKGTGHAVLQAIPDIDRSSTVLILNGDTPLLEAETIRAVCRPGNTLNLLTANLPDPSGMGRILRDGDGNIIRIVEHKDASESEKSISETNTNCMSTGAACLADWLPLLDDQNASKEFYLTDIIACAVNEGVPVHGIPAPDILEIQGINSKNDLERAERIYQARLAGKLMSQGVTIMDSSRFDLRGDGQFGSDCIVDVNVVLEGKVVVGDGVRIGPNTVIRHSTIGDGCVIEANSVIDSATVGKKCVIGPFARIRPDTVLGDRVRIGNFVEVKKSRIGDGSKISHLSYIGDSEIGSGTNIGAGVVTCNYDGTHKHPTTIGNHAFIGSGSQLIAPVIIGDGATIGAGSTITRNVGEDSLALSRVPQRIKEQWKPHNKKGQ